MASLNNLNSLLKTKEKTLPKSMKGELKPIRCDKCDYCKTTQELKELYTIKNYRRGKVLGTTSYIYKEKEVNI
ncbi:hypothetical protein CBOS2020_04920 [Clostridium botulinum]|nr:hypothetical protein CBOS2020_04920 [Clostridium botulinum]